MNDTDGGWADTDIPDDPENWQVGDIRDCDSEPEVTVEDEADEEAAELKAAAKDEKPKVFEDILGPLYWPDVLAANANATWTELRRWVDELLERFPHLDHHVIPTCWWRHNGHVEALAALRDHQRTCYDDSSPPSAAMEWHRAFRDIEARLREWTSTLACGATHDPRGRPSRATDEKEWSQFVEADSERRAQNQPQRQEEPAGSAGSAGNAAEQEEQDR